MLEMLGRGGDRTDGGGCWEEEGPPNILVKLEQHGRGRRRRRETAREVGANRRGRKGEEPPCNKSRCAEQRDQRLGLSFPLRVCVLEALLSLFPVSSLSLSLFFRQAIDTERDRRKEEATMRQFSWRAPLLARGGKTGKGRHREGGRRRKGRRRRRAKHNTDSGGRVLVRPPPRRRRRRRRLQQEGRQRTAQARAAGHGTPPSAG